MPQIYEFEPGAWLKVAGDDAAGFLQNQFSNDLSDASNGTCIYGLWLDRKGHVEADGFVLRAADGFRVHSYFCEGRSLVQRFEHYIIADDVEVSDLSAEMSQLVVWGEGAEDLLNKVGLHAPKPGAFACSEGVYIKRGRWTRSAAFDVVAQKTLITEVSARLQDAHAQPVGRNELDWARMDALMPAVPQELGPQDLPQEGGLGEAEISFTKGCFLGQEAVARLHNRGKTTRSLALVRGEEPVPAAPASLEVEGKNVGELRSALAVGGRWEGIAMIRNRALEATSAFALSGSSTTCSVVKTT